LPTPGTFEENKDYVRKTLIETTDLRLMPNGEYQRLGNLPKDWDSYGYQSIVNADGSPTEHVVRMRMLSAGEELVRVDGELTGRAGEFRIILDDEKAPNTAPLTAAEVIDGSAHLAARTKAMGRD
jgi:hypothetical protein